MTPDVYNSDNYLTLDFEVDTSHGDYGHPVHDDNRLLLACWKTPDSVVHAKWGGEFAQEALLKDIERVDFVVAHNAKYELGWLYRCGADLSKITVFDTKIAEYVLLGNLSAGDKVMAPRSTSLDACCRRRGYPPKDPIVNLLIGDNPVSIPRSWLLGRCVRDVETTEQLFQDQLAHLGRTGRTAVQYTRCLLTPFLAWLEFQGMHLDDERVYTEYDSHVGSLREVTARLEELAGGINWRSSKQLGGFLYDELGFSELKRRDGTPRRTASGQRATDKATLNSLKAVNNRQHTFLEQRRVAGRLSAALSKNLEYFKGVCDEQGGDMYGLFNQTTTATHRLSSSGIPTHFDTFQSVKRVQFQNLPRKFKPLFKARGGGYIAEVDGSQLEFRVAAFLGKDQQAIADIEAGYDIHTFTASVIFNTPEADVTKAQRTAAKAHTFKPLYGGQSGTKAEKRYYKAFKERYAGIARTQQDWVHTVLKDKRLITSWGLRYYWPYARMSGSGYINVTSSVYNYPIQGLATAEIIPLGLVNFWQIVKSRGLTDSIRPINTVHDSLICEVSKDSIDEWKEIAKEAFTTQVYGDLETIYGIKFDTVPLGVGLSWGSHWADPSNQEEEYNIYYDGREERVK